MKKILFILLALPLAVHSTKGDQKYGNPHTPVKNYPVDAGEWRREGNEVVIKPDERHNFRLNQTFFVENLSTKNQLLNARLSDGFTTVQILLTPGEIRTGIVPHNTISIVLRGKKRNKIKSQRLRINNKVYGAIITKDGMLQATKGNRSATAP